MRNDETDNETREQKTLIVRGPRGTGEVIGEVLSSGNVVISANEWRRVVLSFADLGSSYPNDTVTIDGGEIREFIHGAKVVTPSFTWKLSLRGSSAPVIHQGKAFTYRDAIRAAHCGVILSRESFPEKDYPAMVYVFECLPRPREFRNQMPESELVYLERIEAREVQGLAMIHPTVRPGSVEGK